MPDAGLDTTRRVESVCEVPLGAGVLRLLVPSVAVGVIIDRRCLADRVISATRELFSAEEGVEFRRWIVKAIELPPREVSLLPAGTDTCLLAGGS